MITFSRRSILAGATGLAALLPVASSGWAGLAVAEYLDFDVFRNGSDIGHHRIDIRHEGNRTIAKIDILLEVGLGPLVLYRYRHQNTEIWQNGEFLSFSSTTDDDGTPYAVRATRTGRTIRVEPTALWSRPRTTHHETVASSTTPRMADPHQGRSPRSFRASPISIWLTACPAFVASPGPRRRRQAG